MSTRKPTFAEIVDASRREAASRPAVEEPEPLPPVLHRRNEDGILSPTGRQYWRLDWPLVGMQEMQRFGASGAALIVNPLGEGYYCAAYLDGQRAADLRLEWYEPDVVRAAAERSQPVCRSLTIVSLLEDDDGGLLLEVDGDGLIWPPVPRARP